MVMFLREALFRLCETSLNQDFTKKDILDAYTKTIDAALTIVKTDKANADAARAQAKAKAAAAILKLTPDQARAMQ